MNFLRKLLGISERKGTSTTEGAPINDAEWYQREGYYKLAAALGGGMTSYTGKIVTLENALQSAALYAGVKMIGEDLGSLPFFYYQRKGNEIRKATDQPLYPILHDLANPEMGAGEFVEMLTAHALLGMDGFAEIVRNRDGEIIALWPLQANEMQVQQDTATGRLIYLYKRGSANQRLFTREQIFHLRGFTLNGITGDKLLERARQALGLTIAIDEYAGRYFANDATPGVVITRPVGQASLGPDAIQAIKDAWKKWFGGLAKKHEPAVLQEGMTAAATGSKAAESQLIEQRKFQILEVCRLLRLPPYKLADLDRAINANVEQEAIEYTSLTLSPWTRRWRQAVYRCLLTPDERRAGYYAEQSLEAILRGDWKTQAEGFRALLEKGVYSINEVRAWYNLNPVEGGDEHYVQLNMQAVGETANAAAQESQPGKGNVVPIRNLKKMLGG